MNNNLVLLRYTVKASPVLLALLVFGVFLNAGISIRRTTTALIPDSVSNNAIVGPFADPLSLRGNSSNFDNDELSTFCPTLTKNGTWDLPDTIFTPHIQSLVKLFKSCRLKHSLKGTINLHVTVQSSSSVPIIHWDKSNCRHCEQSVVGRSYQNALEKRLFGEKNHKRLMPSGNLSLKISTADYDKGLSKGSAMPCKFSSSARGGRNSVFNFQDIERWSEYSLYPPPLPWTRRNAIPIFRGKGWGNGFKHFIASGEANATDERGHHQRYHLVYFSSLHPDLVDARLSSGKGRTREKWAQNATNGLHRLLPFDPIPERKYYAEYQVHVVLGGKGAAFRLARILGQGIAVVLQDYLYEEWFTHLMIPFVHYIPLAQDLSNLNETLHWVRGNPSKVFEIAMNGKAFHEKYLSYEKMAQFYHELMFRLMLCCASR